MPITEEQILSLSPDEASKKSGRELASAAKWLSRGASETAAWGECKGSGSKPYQTAIDLSNIAFKCSCPSRKFPCKHGIALGLLYVRDQNGFDPGSPPDWTAEWIQKRADKEAKAEEAPKKEPPDEASAAKRLAAREGKVDAGVEELLLWIKDLVRQGLVSVPERAHTFWEGMARRLVDAQAPGLANGVKSLGDTDFYKEGWQGDFLERLLDLYLLAKGYQNRERLSPLLQGDLRTWVGFTASAEALKTGDGVLDHWLVVGKQTTEEDSITVERNWLYGLGTQRFGLVLQFIVRGGGAVLLLSPGMCIEAELVFFPSGSPLRALVKRQLSSTATGAAALCASWSEVEEMETAVAAALPLRTERPYAVAALKPMHHEGGWWLQDSRGAAGAIREPFGGLWKLLALSGGQPMDMVVVGRQGRYEPLGVWQSQTYKPL